MSCLNLELTDKLNKSIEHNEELCNKLKLEKECNDKLKFFNEELIINLNKNINTNEEYINEIASEKE